MNNFKGSDLRSISFKLKHDGTFFNLAIWDGDNWIVCFDNIKDLEKILNIRIHDKSKPNNFELYYR